jgi:enolase
MPKVSDIKAYEVLDSRGNPTVEVQLTLQEGFTGRAIVPSGASTGSYEALELRDQDPKRFLGKGTLKAVDNVNQILGPQIKGREFKDQRELDTFIIKQDGTDNKSRLGANAILGVSLAFAYASSAQQGKALFSYIGTGKILPTPMMNLINGGVHADNNLDPQEFMIVPAGFDSFPEALRAGSEIFHNLRAILKSKGYFTGVGDEGGFAPNLKGAEEALQILVTAIEKAGYTPGREVYLALDVAASELYQDGGYLFRKSKEGPFSASGLIDLYERWVRNYPILSIEDGLAEDDWEGWREITVRLGSRVRLVGDDLFVTNPARLQRGISERIANSILVKPNQIGTLSETLDVIKMAKEAGYATIISHRSGESEDTTIADLAVGTDAGLIKTGSVSRTDRIAKYNQLLRIQRYLGAEARFAGLSALKV